MWMTKVPTSVTTVALNTEFAATQTGGAVVNAITRFAAPAAVAGGQTGAIAVFETGSVVAVVVVTAAVVVVDLAAVGFLDPPLERRATRAMMTPIAITRVTDRRVLRARRLCRSWTASF